MSVGTLPLYDGTPIRGIVRHALKNGEPTLVRVDDNLAKCVAFIGFLVPTGEVSLQGTVFFVTRHIPDTTKAVIYMVTARHVIEGIEGLGHKTCIIRMNTKSGEALGYEVRLDAWLFHPEESEVDIAVLPYFLSQDLDHLAIEDTTIIEDVMAREENIGLGDEVFIAGMFYDRIGNDRNIPIVRVGNIAAMPHPGERVRTLVGLIDAYLIELRSLGGMSGAPVFVNLGVTRNIKGQIRHSKSEFNPSYLIGLIHGHYDYKIKQIDEQLEDGSQMIQLEERINKGIAIVVPSNKILEVINQPVLKDAEKRAREELLKETMPTADMVDSEDEPLITKEAFESVLKRVSRKTAKTESKDSDKTE